MAPKIKSLQVSAKNETFTAAQRKAYHQTAPNNRYNRDVQELTRLINLYSKNCQITDGNLIVIFLRTKSLAHQFSAIINRFSYIADDTDGRIARQKDDTYVLITFKHYQGIVKEFKPELLSTLNHIPPVSARSPYKSLGKDDMFNYGNTISQASRENYHVEHPDRLTRDVNALKEFFKKTLKNNMSTGMLEINIADNEERHTIVRALNNFSYVIEDNTEGRATKSEQGHIFIPDNHYQQIKSYVLALKTPDKKNAEPPPSAAQRKKYHQDHPERVKPDFNATLEFLTHLNANKKLSHTYVDQNKAKNVYGSINRCAYLIEKDELIVEKDKLKISMTDAENYTALYQHFFKAKPSVESSKATQKPIIVALKRKQEERPQAKEIIETTPTKHINMSIQEETSELSTSNTNQSLDAVIDDFIFDDPMGGFDSTYKY